MCGICGVRRFGDEPITEDQVVQLLLANMPRGNHATGLALQNPGEEIHVLKMPEPAVKFITTGEFKQFLADHLKKDTYTFLGHTRLATRGDPQKNVNNHPLYTTKTAVVHNGMLNNDDFLFKDLKLDRAGEVDSDIFRAILDARGLTPTGAETCNRLSGSAAIAAISNDYPGKLLLARSGNPIVLAGTEGQLIWSSEKQAIHWAMRPFVKRHGLLMQRLNPGVDFQTMTDHSAYLFNEEGLDWHQKFTVASYYRAPQYNVRKTYRSMRERWFADEKPTLVFCKICNQWKDIPKQYQSLALWELSCVQCNTHFMLPPEEKARLTA